MSSEPPKEDTVESLKSELVAVKEKFANWQTKAKEGVAQLRAQVKSLKAEREQHQTSQLAMLELEALRCMDAESDSCLGTLQSLFEMGRRHQHTISKKEQSSGASPAESQPPPSTAGGQQPTTGQGDVKQQYEKYKRRMDMSLRVMSSDLESARQEVEALSKTVKEKEGEIESAKLTCSQYENGMEALAKQLQDSMETIEQLQSKLAQNTDQNSMRREELVMQADALQREFEELWKEREAQLNDSHREEMSRLMLEHDREIEELAAHQSLSPQATYSNTLLDTPPTSKDKAAGQPHGSSQLFSPVQREPSAVGGCGGDDEAYMQLLDDLQKVQDQLKAKGKETEELREQLQKYEKETKEHNSKMAAAKKNGANNGMQRDGAAGPIAELQHKLQVQSEQVWSLNQQLLEAKAKQNSAGMHGGGGGSGAGGPDAQQKAYLRSVFVQFACAKDETVSGKLIPVLTSLLELKNDELRAMYAAHPSWLKK